MSILNEIKCHKIRATKTFILYLILMTVGMTTALPGVTLLDLQIAVNTTLDKIALIIPAHSAGVICGAVICGILVEIMDFQKILIAAVFLITFSVGYFPWNRNYIALLINSAINGFLIGFISTGGNTWVLHLWGTYTPPFLQAFHFSFGFGAFVAPLIAEPFLLPLQEPNLNATNTDEVYTSNDLKIGYTYGITSLFTLLTSISFTIAYLCRREMKPHSTISDENKETAKEVSKPIRITIIIATCVFMFFFYGVELCFGQLLTPYVVNCDLKLGKSTASFMTSLFWATFTFSRFFTIFMINIFSSETLMVINLTFVLLSNAVMLPFANTQEWALWTGIALIGFGTSPLFATVFGFLQDFMKVSTKVSSLFIISCYTGTFVLPYIVGNYIADYPYLFLYVTCTCSLMLCVSFVIMKLLKNIHLKNMNHINKN